MIPEPRVQAHLHGGPHDGETVMLPWARIEIPVLRWEADEAIVSVYHLDGPWREPDTATAHYRHAAPAPEPAPPASPGLVARVCLWLSGLLASVAESRS